VFNQGWTDGGSGGTNTANGTVDGNVPVPAGL
jgi:hypothetical protein